MEKNKKSNLLIISLLILLLISLFILPSIAKNRRETRETEQLIEITYTRLIRIHNNLESIADFEPADLAINKKLADISVDLVEINAYLVWATYHSDNGIDITDSPRFKTLAKTLIEISQKDEPGKQDYELLNTLEEGLGSLIKELEQYILITEIDEFTVDYDVSELTPHIFNNCLNKYMRENTHLF